MLSECGQLNTFGSMITDYCYTDTNNTLFTTFFYISSVQKWIQTMYPYTVSVLSLLFLHQPALPNHVLVDNNTLLSLSPFFSCILFHCSCAPTLLRSFHFIADSLSVSVALLHFVVCIPTHSDSLFFWLLFPSLPSFLFYPMFGFSSLYPLMRFTDRNGLSTLETLLVHWHKGHYMKVFEAYVPVGVRVRSGLKVANEIVTCI